MRPWVVGIIVLHTGCGFRITAGSGEDASPADDAREDASAAGDAAPSDAVIADGPFDPSTCPGPYNVSIASTMTTSRYRFKKAGGSAKNQALDCANDGTNTHIVSLDSTAEIQELHAAADGAGGWTIDTINHPNNTLIYVGGVQLKDQTELGTGWLSYAGAAQVAAWAVGEPNDYDFTEDFEDNEEQVLVMWLERSYLADMVPRLQFGVICECDTTPPSPAFAAAWLAAVGP